MFIYNVTTQVSKLVANNWLAWMKNEHIPAIMHTNTFTRFQLVKLVDVDEMDGPTYALQLFAESRAIYNLYMEKYAVQLRQEAFKNWGDNIISFRSLMQVVE